MDRRYRMRDALQSSHVHVRYSSLNETDDYQTCIPAAFAPITATRIPIGARAPTTFIEIEEPRGFIDLSTALGHKLTCYGHAPVTC